MPAPSSPPISRVDLQRRDTEIAVAVFRTVFLLIVIFSPQFVDARGMRGNLLIVATAAAALYNVVLFVLHMQRISFPRPIIVMVDTFFISLWVYFAGPEADRFFGIYFAVVIVAGLWFRRGGALATALLACLLYVWALSISPLPPGVERVGVRIVTLQVILLLVTAGVVSIAAEVQEREREELTRSRAVLQQHWERIRIAQHVDDMIRPTRLPATPGLNIVFRFRPAAQVVSGDYYDVVPLGPRRWGIIVADVRAKEELGLFYLPLFKSAVRLAVRREPSPARALKQINGEVAAEMGDRKELEAFIGMSYSIVDLDMGRLTYANAGTEPGVILRAVGSEIVSLDAHGIVLGVQLDADYEEESYDLHTGDTIVLFTDGMTEAFDKEERFLGRDGLVKQIAARADVPSAEALAQGVFDYVLEYTRESRHRDDQTLVVARVVAPNVSPHPDPSAV